MTRHSISRSNRSVPAPDFSALAFLCKSIAAKREAGENLTIGKRGVYLIAGNTKVRTFRLVPWEQIFERLTT